VCFLASGELGAFQFRSDGRPADGSDGRRIDFCRDAQQRILGLGDAFMADLTYQVAPGGPIVFVAHVDGFGPVEVKTSRKRIFSCRVTDRHAREAALCAVEAFVDEHAAKFQVHYDEIAEFWLTPRVA